MVNIARYYYHKIVYIGGKEDNIYNNIYKGLDIIKAVNYKLKDLIILLRLAKVKISIKKGQSSNKKSHLAILTPYYRLINIYI